MYDSFGRTIDYLRLSVTDRCNLRCVYCMPPQGVTWIPHTDILSFEELLRLVRVMADSGITKIKVTGGEVLTRRAVVDLIGRLKQTQGIQRVTMTSNGVLLAEHLDALVAAGLDALNISVDTLNAETFNIITRSAGFDQLMQVIEKTGSLPFPVKINCVPIRGLNDSEIAAIAGLAKSNAAAVRFIELMPLGCAANFQMLPRKEIIAEIEKVYGSLTVSSGSLGNGPAVYYSLEGFTGKIGFISPLSHNFCGTCNRLRLSATGLLMPCLSGSAGLDLRALLRGSGNDDAALATAIRALVLQKPRCHTFADTADTGQRDREMFRIGG